MSFRVGDIVCAYKVLGIVGSGGMGEVYKVEHTITKRIEAMKVVISSHPADSENTQRFLREIQVQASLHHPNITSVHNAFAIGDDLVMVMELVEGNTLESLLKQRPIPISRAIDYTRQVLAALNAAHLHGIIHRDVTPANIIVTPEGFIKLTDFGLAKAPAQLRLTQSGRLMGSPYFMSPEQVRGVTALDARTDIYSLGAVVYEMVTGKKPFEGEDAFTIMRAQVESRPIPPVEIEPSVPAGLNTIILKALEKDPWERFQMADEFLAAVLQVEGIDGEAPAQLEAPARPGKRAMQKLSVGVAVLTGAAVLVSVGIAPFSMPVEKPAHFERSREPEPAVPAVTPAPPPIEAPAPASPNVKKKGRSRFWKTMGKIVHPWK
jgi:serine/threonine protein kinase